MFYKIYQYSMLATLVSVLGSLGAVFSAAGAVICFSKVKENAVMILPGVLLATLAFASYWFIYRKLSDKVAENAVDKKLRNNPSFAARYCNDHPGSYDQICELNPSFASMYSLNEKGKAVKNG